MDIITSLVPRPQSSPAPSNTPLPSPTAPAHTPPTPRGRYPRRCRNRQQNSAFRMHILRRRPIILHNSGVSASLLPPSSHGPRNSHTQTPPVALWAPFHDRTRVARRPPACLPEASCLLACARAAPRVPFLAASGTGISA